MKLVSRLGVILLAGVVEKREVIVVHERDCWSPGHCKGLG
jgi:hypothetical protein